VPSEPRVVELFAGAGGMALGFRAAGCRIVAAADIDESAGRTFLHNFTECQPDDPPLVVFGGEGNLEDLDLPRLGSHEPIDVLIGGPPCQGFSRAGRAKINNLRGEGAFAADPRNRLYRRFLDATELWQPRAVVMENVPGMLSVAGRNIAEEVAADIAVLGYKVAYALINAVWFGVPQFRERIFFLGIRDDLDRSPRLPNATHRAELPAGYQRPVERNLGLPFVRHSELSIAPNEAALPAMTARDALEDLPAITAHLSHRGEERAEHAYREAMPSAYGELMRNWPGFPTSRSVRDHVIRRTPRDYETFRRMKSGDRYPDAIRIANERLEEELTARAAAGHLLARDTPQWRELKARFVPPYPEAIFRDRWRKLIPDQPSWTIPAHLSKDAYSHIHYDSTQARAISIREAARLQSFPDAFVFQGNMGDRYRQVGNAVPPLLAWALAAQVLIDAGYDKGSVAPPPELATAEKAVASHST
jgi:DNA (cytosine-5)-methyltransferase 1